MGLNLILNLSFLYALNSYIIHSHNYVHPLLPFPPTQDWSTVEEGEVVSPLTRTACVALLVPEIATPPPHRTQTIPRPPLGSSQASPRNNSHTHSHTHLSTLIMPLSTAMSVPNTPCVTVSIIVMNTTVLYVRTKGSTVYSTELDSCAIGILCMYVYTICYHYSEQFSLTVYTLL